MSKKKQGLDVSHVHLHEAAAKIKEVSEAIASYMIVTPQTLETLQTMVEAGDKMSALKVLSIHKENFTNLKEAIYAEETSI